jgi:penicillin amidase
MRDSIKLSLLGGIFIKRDPNGIPNVQANTEAGLYAGMGYCHASDRGMQMLLMRILGYGRASEYLESSDELLEVDRFFRKMNWHGNLEEEIEKLSNSERSLVIAYCQGVNEALIKSIPWEFRLMGYKPEPWEIRDSVLLSRMIGFLTLAQSQGEIERLLVEMVQAGVSQEKLDALFPKILEGLDKELVKKISGLERIVPETVKWMNSLSPSVASNNWVIAGGSTHSGKPILANDPHLETNRLPNVWYELVLETPTRYAISTTMPGIPGILIGRTNDLAWGATYSFMDSIDSRIEHCKNRKYRVSEAEWTPFKMRKEIIHRKKKPDVELVFYENNHGVLEGDPNVEGFYLTTKWSGAEGGARSLSGILRMWHAATVEEGMTNMGLLESSFNWVFADKEGNIGYQMSGLMPIRPEGISGFAPLPGWEAKYDWKGYADPINLPRTINPPEGFFVTANHNLNSYGKLQPINMPMGSYRADRIRSELEGRNDWTTDHCFQLQNDLFSIQAEQFMAILKPLLPDSEKGNILKEWDLHYDIESKGAFLFEQIYKALFQEVFGTDGLGEKVIRFLQEGSGIFVDFYANFDNILLAEESVWFNGKSRDSLFKNAISTGLNRPVKKWGDENRIRMTHILFGGKLPAFLGFDKGPFPIPGGRGTVMQGQVYKSAGRETSFTPSFRMVTDMAEDASYTNLAGGPSDRRFSKWYVSDLQNWIKGRYKQIKPLGST